MVKNPVGPFCVQETGVVIDENLDERCTPAHPKDISPRTYDDRRCIVRGVLTESANGA